MTEELQKYLEKTKNKRKELAKIAEKYQENFGCPSKVLLFESQKNEFPHISPIRFKRFRDTLQHDMQVLYESVVKKLEKTDKNRSVSLRRSEISSIYTICKPTKKRMSILPPIERRNESVIIQKVLAEKNDSDAGLNLSADYFKKAKPEKRLFNQRFEVKKQLLVPILQKNVTKSAE